MPQPVIYIRIIMFHYISLDIYFYKVSPQTYFILSFIFNVPEAAGGNLT